MIPIALFEKFSCQRPIGHITIGKMTRNSRKTNKFRYVEICKLHERMIVEYPHLRMGHLQYQNQNLHVSHKFWMKQNHEE